MSLSDITLPGSIIAGLYSKSLVQMGTLNEPVPAINDKTGTSGNNYKFLGNNQQQVTIIVNSKDDTFLPDSELQFLTKMLEACKLNLGDVAIVNHGKTPVVMEKIKEQLNPLKVLLFGVEPVDTKLPMNFPQFKEQAYAGCSYLYSPPLEALSQKNEKGKLLKSKIWVCLQKVFNV